MRLLLTGLVFIAVLAVPFFVWGNLFSEDVQVLEEKIKDYGVWPWLAGIFLLVADILLPIPATAVMAALAFVGPLAINIDASQWKDYESGVFDGCGYDDMDIDHVVVLVGYGTDEAEGDYWLARNSWGPGWGEDGYIRMKRDQKARCGVNSSPLNGSACVGGPGSDQQMVCGMCGMLLDASYPMGAQLVKNSSWIG